MSERFIKFIPSEEAFWLMQKKPNAFYLLTHIANTARRYEGHPDGLSVGQCHLKSAEKYGFTIGQYRAAKNILVKRKHIEITETNRNRKKSTTGTTTVSTLVRLCSSTVYDINQESNDNRNDNRTTTERQQTRKNKKEKEDLSPYPLSFDPASQDQKISGSPIDQGERSFSANKQKKPGENPLIHIYEHVYMTEDMLNECISIRGSREDVDKAVELISRKAKYSIKDWPSALRTWKVDDSVQTNSQRNTDLAEKLIKRYENYSDGNGYRCRHYRDRVKDQIGVLFEADSPYVAPTFFALSDGRFYEKVTQFQSVKKMSKGSTAAKKG